MFKKVFLRTERDDLQTRHRHLHLSTDFEHDPKYQLWCNFGQNRVG